MTQDSELWLALVVGKESLQQCLLQYIGKTVYHKHILGMLEVKYIGSKQ